MVVEFIPSETLQSIHDDQLPHKILKLGKIVKEKAILDCEAVKQTLHLI